MCHWIACPALLLYVVLAAIVLSTMVQDEFGINGAPFASADDVAYEMTLGSVQEWRVDADHPFHMHVNHFQLVDAGCEGECAFGFEAGNFYDVIMNGARQVLIRFKPVDYKGRVVLHCHILAHEDQGMMAVAKIV